MKKTKQQANYVPISKTNHCDTCEHWRDGACSVVQGAINAKGTSDLYERDVRKTSTGKRR